MTHKPQVERPHYFKPSYYSPKRFASYGHQVHEILKCNTEKVLEVGIGNGFVSHVLRQVGLKITTLDIDANLKPDIVASVIDIPLSDDTFDLVCCFEVLEHIPFEFFAKALSEIARTTCNYALISLPDIAHFFKLEILMPCLGNRCLSFSIPRFYKRIVRNPEEHYWEISVRQYPLKRIMKNINQSGFNILKTYQSPGNSYHRFFLLRKILKDGK